jgi:hypothetical protein
MLKPHDSRISILNFVRHVKIRWLQEAKQTKLYGVTKASRADHKAAAQLLMKAMAEENVPFNFVTSHYFQAYVAFVSGLSYSTPYRHDVVKALEDICDIAQRCRSNSPRPPSFPFRQTAGRVLGDMSQP